MERVLVPTTCRRRRSRLNLRAFLASFLVACAGRPSPGALFISGSPTQGNCSFRRRKPTNYSKAPAEAGAAPGRGPQRCSDAGVLFPRAAPFAVIREAINKKGMVAIGKVVFTSREHMIALEARGKLRETYGVVPAFLMSYDAAPDRLREARASGLHLLHKPVDLFRAPSPKNFFRADSATTGTVLISTAIHAHALASVFA